MWYHGHAPIRTKAGGRSVVMTVQITRRPFTVADYARMRETGILSEDDRVELIDGEVRVMSPIGPIHAAIVKRLNTLLNRLLHGTVILSVQDPIQLHDYSEPQPDLAILQYRDDFYAQAHPVADDVLLVIEVSDTTVEYDRDEKLPTYAHANIAEAWLIDVNSFTVEQYMQPRNGKYLMKQIFERGDTITAQSVAALQIDVDRIFE
jgi:Uma2 family endonuclease